MKTILKVIGLVSLLACGSRADLEAGRYYRCDAAAGGVEQQCPGGWVCTQDGFCQDPAVGATLRCQTSADCTGGWHCGVEGQCYDRSTVTDLKCRQEDPEDCAPGWRCGLEGVCHDTAQAAAYRCEGDDSRCEQGWRCGPQGLCVDSRGEALRPAVSAANTQRISPTYPVIAEEVAGTGDFTHPTTAETRRVYAIRTPSEVWFGTWGYDQGTSAERRALPGVQRLAVAGTAAFYLDADGLKRVEAAQAPLGAPATIDLTGLGPVTGMKNVADVRHALAVYSGNKLGFVAQGETAVSRITPFPAGATVLDLTDFSYREAYASAEDTAHGLLVATEQGLYVAFQSVDGSPVALPTLWRPIAVPGVGNSACGAAPTARPTRVRGVYDYYSESWFLAVELTPISGGKPQVTVLERAAATYPTVNCPSNQFTVVVPPVDPCPGGTLVDLDVDSDGELLARCQAGEAEATTQVYRGEDGGTQVYPLEATWWSDPADGPLIPSPSSATRTVLDPTGRLGNCRADDYHFCWWEGLSRSPLGMINLEDGGYGVVTHDYDYDFSLERWYPYADLQEPDAFGMRTRYWGLGFEVARPADATLQPPCSFPRGPRDQVAFCIPGQDVALYDLDVVTDSYGYQEYPVPEVVLSGSASAWSQAARQTQLPAQSAGLPDGGQVLVMAVGDALWAGAPESQLTDGGPARLHARLVPQPRGEVSALAVSSAPSDGLQVEAYVIAQERVYRVEARSDQQWQAQPIDLPPGIPTAVWTDGPRGRAGYSDGRVYSLPSGVQVAPPIPGGEALDYAALCGHGYALTRDTLYRLQGTAGPQGQWQPLDLSGVGLPPEGLIFYGWQEAWAPYFYLPDYPAADRLIEANRELLLFTEAGAMIRVRDPECSSAD